MRSRRSVLVLVLVLGALLVPGAAVADDPVTVVAEGEARAGKDARTSALDAAFGAAVARALGKILPSDTLKANSTVLRNDLVRRARLYITQFSVTDQKEQEGVLRLRISAQVDLDRLRERLAELGISASATAGAGQRPRLVLLLHATVGDDTMVTFGKQGGDGGVAGQAFLQALREQGFEVDLASGSAVAASIASGDSGSQLPVGDEAAAELARRLGAGGAVVVAIEVRPDGRIRGTRFEGAAARGAVRVVGADAAVVAQGQVGGAGFAAAIDQAAARAAADVSRRAVRSITRSMETYWPLPLVADAGMSVRVTGVTDWRVVQALIEALADTTGIDQVYPRAFRRGEVILAVETRLTARNLAAAATATRSDAGRVRARVAADDLVEVRVE